MATQEEIQARIEKSNAGYQQRKAAQLKEKSDRKEGISYIHDNKIAMMRENFPDGSVLMIAVEEKEAKVRAPAGVDVSCYVFSFALCSSKDTFSLKIAKGLLGKRLKEENKDYYFDVLYKSGMSKEDILRMGMFWISINAIGGNPIIPDRLRRLVRRKQKYEYGTSFYGVE